MRGEDARAPGCFAVSGDRRPCAAEARVASIKDAAAGCGRGAPAPARRPGAKRGRAKRAVFERTNGMVRFKLGLASFAAGASELGLSQMAPAPLLATAGLCNFERTLASIMMGPPQAQATKYCHCGISTGAAPTKRPEKPPAARAISGKCSPLRKPGSCQWSGTGAAAPKSAVRMKCEVQFKLRRDYATVYQ